MSRISAPIRGIYRDILKDRDQNIIYDSGRQNNLIVTGCRTLLAALMLNHDTPGGIKSLKIGQGDPAWDQAGGPPPPQPDDTTLTDVPNSIAISDLQLNYLDANDQVSSTPTNRLQIRATLNEQQPPLPPGETHYPMREFGLFGQYTDPGGTQHEYMIDYIRHKVINKDKNTTLERVVWLYF